MLQPTPMMALQTGPTNLLAMPAVDISVITGTNEDWIDSLVWIVADTATTDSVGNQLDLTGIRFDMEIRREVSDNEVAIRASTEDGTLRIGDPPNFGFLLIGISHEQMKAVFPGSYVGDIVGRDTLSVRRVVAISLEIVEGITRP